MEKIKVNIPGFGEDEGTTPIVILGPNGSGKTKLAQKIANDSQVSAISAQRQIWVNESLSVQEERNLRSNINSQIEQWKSSAWQPTQEINYILVTLIQEHNSALNRRNETAVSANTTVEPTRDTKLMRLQGIWDRLFPTRKLEIDFFPKVRRLDATDSEQASYHIREMSDGERTILYMAARIMTTDQSVILVDEPELHMHSRLAVQFWNEAENLRPDCRFIYITHDLNFALSRRSESVYIVRSVDKVEQISISDLPSSIATEVLGAATLPFYARRIFLYEGEPGAGFASEFFSVWFDNKETFAIPCGGRSSVCAAVIGLKKIGVAAAEVIGLVDRDFYPNSILDSSPEGVRVLPLHELESVLCDQQVVICLARHLGKDPDKVWETFIENVKKTVQGDMKSYVVAQRVRERVGDLLDGGFKSSQIEASISKTSQNHSKSLTELDLPNKIGAFFNEESERVDNALASNGKEMLAILPGKRLLNLLPKELGLSHSSELTSLVIQSLNRNLLKADGPLFQLGEKLEEALSVYLPKRRV